MTMSQLKSIIFTALFCLLFCTTELYALERNELNLEKQETTFSLDVIVKSLDGVIDGLGESLDGTLNGIGKSLDGAMNGLGELLEETVEVVEAENVAAYIHQGNRLATILGLNNSGFDQIGRELAMQVAAMSPIAVDQDATLAVNRKPRIPGQFVVRAHAN